MGLGFDTFVEGEDIPTASDLKAHQQNQDHFAKTNSSPLAPSNGERARVRGLPTRSLQPKNPKPNNLFSPRPVRRGEGQGEGSSPPDPNQVKMVQSPTRTTSPQRNLRDIKRKRNHIRQFVLAKSQHHKPIDPQRVSGTDRQTKFHRLQQKAVRWERPQTGGGP